MIEHDLTTVQGGSPFDTIPAYVGGNGTQEYDSPGAYEFTVPAGTDGVLRSKLWGAGGGACQAIGSENGGGGAFVQCDFQVTEGEVLVILIGGGGKRFNDGSPPDADLHSFNGGGRAYEGQSGASKHGADGGGATSIFRKEGRELICIAGGGGGGGVEENGAPGVADSGTSIDGSQTAGGESSGGDMSDGSFLQGGHGEVDYSSSNGNGGAGGGGGFYGGAGGNSVAGTTSPPSGSEGGGGSSWAHPTQTANVTKTSGSGRTAGGSGDGDYADSAGLGGLGSSIVDGNPGRVYLSY